MSKTSDLQTKIHTLTEIESILGAMKNLALIEMTKVSKLMSAQNKVSSAIDAALFDFESFYRKDLLIESKQNRVLCILFGSERGFCGPFNEQVINTFRESTKDLTNFEVVLIGRKLISKLEYEPSVKIQIDGPNSADEIPSVIVELAEKLLPYAGWRWMFIQNDGNGAGLYDMVSFPLEMHEQKGIKMSYPPILNMSPQELYPQLMEQHLFSIMHRALYASFLTENRERLHHMDGAVNQIARNRTWLSLKLNGQRQEEITEELEILMLSTEA